MLKVDAVTSDDFATKFIEAASTFRQYGPLKTLAEAVQDGREWIEKPAQFS